MNQIAKTIEEGFVSRRVFYLNALRIKKLHHKENSPT
jgi:hypothetical protein